jgi:alpha-tubulin suppressor-like RCC1 family protein
MRRAWFLTMLLVGCGNGGAPGRAPDAGSQRDASVRAPDGSSDAAPRDGGGAPAFSLAVGESHGCVGAGGRGVYCWGQDDAGQLGQGAPIAAGGSATPLPVPGTSGVVEVAAGRWHTCARLGDGRVLCWGGNDRGQAGAGRAPALTCSELVFDGGQMDRPCQPTPQELPEAAGALAIAAGGDGACALVAGGKARCWGAAPAGLGQAMGVSRVTLAEGAACAVIAGGALSCDGQNDVLYRTEAVQMLRDVRALAIGVNHLCLLRGEAIDCVGDNANGQLGRGDDQLVSFGLTHAMDGAVALVAGTNHTCAARADGTVACWGRTELGQAGVLAAPTSCRGGPCVPRPATVVGLDGVTQLAAGGGQTCALRGAGDVLCFGGERIGHGGPEPRRIEPAWKP